MRALLVVLLGTAAMEAAEVPAEVESARQVLTDQLARLPDVICAQTVERERREKQADPFGRTDTLRLEVTVIGGKERFAWNDASRFDDRDLRDLVRRGVVGTGAFANFARHVLLGQQVRIRPAGTEAVDGRELPLFEYDVAWEDSRYIISNPPNESAVAFRGSFVLDPENGNLVRLEVFSDEIPPELGFETARTSIRYGPVPVSGAPYWMPASAVLQTRLTDGSENRNTTTISGCRRYAAESTLLSSAEPEQPKAKPALRRAPAVEEIALPSRTILEMGLDHEIALQSAQVGDSIRALLSRPLIGGSETIAPAGSAVLGRIRRLDLIPAPYEHYELAIEFHTLETPSGRLALSATLVDTESESGLVKQQKTFMPTFDKRQKTRFDILVRETPRGQGVLHFSAKKPRVRSGFQMKWRTE